MVQKVLDRRLQDSDAFFQDMGGFSLSSETVSVKAVNLSGQKKRTLSIPRMMIAKVFEPSTYIDVIREKFGGNYGLFQRVNEAGDMVLIDPWAKGDSVTGDTKPVTLETGYELRVPPFIEEGGKITVDTRTGEYVTRVKE